MTGFDIKPLQGQVTIPELMELADEMFHESRFAPLGVDGDKLFFHVSNILSGAQWLAFGAFDSDVLCGMVVGVCGTVLPFTHSVVAIEHYLFLKEGYRGGDLAPRLIGAFQQEALRRGARDITLSNGFGGDPKRVEKLYERCGAVRIGSIFTLGA